MHKQQYTLAELTKGLDVAIKGDSHCLIHGVCSIAHAEPGRITFLSNPAYKKYLTKTLATAVILTEKDVDGCDSNIVISSNPYYTYAKIAEFFLQPMQHSPSIHETASIGDGCHIADTVIIGAHCVIGNHVSIGDHVIIGPGSVIGDDVVIGEHSKLDAHVTLYHHVNIGQRTHISSGVVIGADGFGFANHQGHWHKVPQLGSVVIGNDVDIGANTTIDRGAVLDTVIEDGVKLDNLIQIGHNVKIGAHTIIAGCTGIAGSTVVGKHCMIGGASCLAGHIVIADKVMITGLTAVTKSIDTPGIYSSGIVGAVPNHEFRKNNARFHRLENLMERIKTLEIQMNARTEEK